MARLRKSAKKTKEILSANNFAPVSVEGLHDEVDFRSEIYRDAFEKARNAVPQSMCPLARSHVGIRSLYPEAQLQSNLRSRSLLSPVANATAVARCEKAQRRGLHPSHPSSLY